MSAGPCAGQNMGTPSSFVDLQFLGSVCIPFSHCSPLKVGGVTFIFPFNDAVNLEIFIAIFMVT